MYIVLYKKFFTRVYIYQLMYIYIRNFKDLYKYVGIPIVKFYFCWSLIKNLLKKYEIVSFYKIMYIEIMYIE